MSDQSFENYERDKRSLYKSKGKNSSEMLHESIHPCKKSKRELRLLNSSQSQNSFQKPNISEINELYCTDKEFSIHKAQGQQRRVKLDKLKKNKMKKKQQWKRQCHQYDSVMAENIAEESFRVKSPHVILSTKTFNKIKLNVIMLTDLRIEDTSRNRKVFYNIKYMSDNVVMHKKSKYYNVSTSSTKGNCIFILVAFHKVMHLNNLVFFY